MRHCCPNSSFTGDPISALSVGVHKVVINRNRFIKTLGNTVTLVAGTETKSGVIRWPPTAVIPHSITHTAVNPRAPPG